MARDAPPKQLHLQTLLALVKLGAAASFADVSSSRLGKSLGLTQQAASGRLIALESAGLAERRHSGRGLLVRLTPEGLGEVRSFYGELKGAIEESPTRVEFRGRVFTGFAEGGYYVSLEGYAKHFREALGFEPFAGTLNLRLTTSDMADQKGRLASLTGVEVEGFQDGKRSFGPVKCFRAQVGRYPAAVLAIERTHYDNTVLEVISPLNLRKTLKLKDGDECSVTVYPE